MIKIKVSGITNLDDALDAISLGIDALGFFFYDSPWQIDLQEAKDIASKLPPFITRVAIFQNEDPELVNTVVSSTGMDVVQLEGSESPEYCEQIQSRVIKSFHLANKNDLKEIEQYQDKVSALLLDTYSEQNSKSSKAFDWGLAAKAREYKIPIMMSCDLQQADILKAVKTVKPGMLDIKTIIEKSPGIKDYNKLQEIMKILKKEI